MEIRPLRPEDDRSGFSSGDADLDRFFMKYAGQNQFKHHIGTTYVASEGEAMLGYLTVSMAHIEVENLPERVARRFPRYPLPVLRLARLAVSARTQGQGIGSSLLLAAFRIALSQADVVGCVGLVVDAKPKAVEWYTRYGFIPMPVLEGESAARPRPTPMFLALGTVRAAMDAEV